MHCFNHPVIAIGVCKHCQRALCSECCVDLGHGLACKSHEAEVKHYNDLIENAKRAYEASPRTVIFGPLASLIIGVIFVYFGFPHGLNDFSFIFGTALIIFGIIYYIYIVKYLKKLTTKY